jgi:hypothetical protein
MTDMATVHEKHGSGRQRPAQTVDSLHVSTYERVASLIVALLILVGATVFVLFVIWLSNRIFSSPTSVPVYLEDVGGGRPDGIIGESMELDAPDAAAISKETDLAVPQIEETLAKVSSVIAARLSELEDPSLQEPQESGGGRLQGDGRRVGYGFGDGPPGIPRYKRWEIYYSDGGTLEEYAKQLDFFQIELGIVGGEQVIYLTNLSQAKPTSRTGPGTDETRLYMSWRQGNLKQADRELLAKAGINAPGRIIVQFYPAEIERQLAQLEVAFADRKPEQIRRTRFGVRSQGDGYEYYVIDQIPL